MAYDPTAYARKKAEAKEKADKLKLDRDSRKSELDAQAAERKAAMDALKVGNKPPPPSSTSGIATPAPRAIPAPATRAPPAPSSSSGGGGGDFSELLARIQALETEVHTLRERDQSRQREMDRMSSQISKLESEVKSARTPHPSSGGGGDEIKKPTLASPATKEPTLREPSPKPSAVPKAETPAKPAAPAPPKPAVKTPAPAPPPAESPAKPAPRPAVEPPKEEPLRPAAAAAAAHEPEETPEEDQGDLDELPVGGGSNPAEFEGATQDSGPLETCSGCSRTFNAKAMKTHAKICKKVFQTKRKAFKVELIDPEQLEDFRPPKKDPKKEKAALEEKKDKVPKWKQETEQLRAALKAGREMQKALAAGVALKDIPVAAVPAQADDRVTCPHCGRKFAETTAERHIPACKNSKATAKKK